MQDVIETEAQLRDDIATLAECEERLDSMDRDDPERVKYIKKVTTWRLTLARSIGTLTMLKAQYGVIGHSWYNGNTGDAS